VIVVGLGAMGSAACAHLAARGASVLGIDQFAPPHAWGSTHGETRITRLAIGEGREYVPLVLRSHALWRELEEVTGQALLTQPGFVILADPTSPFLAETRAAARAYEVPHEDLGYAELRTRFPMFSPAADTEGYFEPAGGYLRPELAVTAHLQLASRHGAQLRVGERVRRWAASPNGVLVTTDTDSYAADQLLLCAGSWIGELFPDGRDLFAVYRQLMYWFEIRQGHAQLRDMPVFVWDFGGHRAGFEHLDGFYGFPAVDGSGGGLKLGTETFQHTAQPDGHQHPASVSEVTRIYERYVRPHLPWLGPQALRTASCLYTSTRGCRFLIDRHPDHDAVTIVSACSGHGFKHSPAIGEAVAQWLTGQQPDVDLGPFSLDRVAGA
jgi:sarcosine oxidase